MSTAIEIRNLVKVFNPGKGETRAVDGVSLDIAPGELFFLLGPSGCGKTTLLRMIAGFIDPTSGRIAFNGRDVTHTPPNKRNTGMVFQSYALWPHMTVEQNVAFGLNVRKVGGADKSRRVREALEAVRLAEYAKRKPNQLSGGQQQRVALARALVIRPDVLLLDEPLSNLDAKLRIELRGEIRRICKESGITSIYVTHDQKEALSMADRVAIMDAGRVVQLGTPSICYRRPANRFVAAFLGETNFLPATVESVESDGLTLRCSAGTLRAATPEHTSPGVGDEVLCSIRPEAVRLVRPDEPGALTAKHAETVYLGELAQHTVALDGVRLRIAELNPTGGDRGPAPHHEADRSSPGGAAPTIGLRIDPKDVVVLPDPPSAADARAHTLETSAV